MQKWDPRDRYSCSSDMNSSALERGGPGALFTCQDKSVYNCKPDEEIFLPKMPIKRSDFVLTNIKSCPKKLRNIFVSLLADLRTLGTKKQKTSIF